jgi:transposase
VAYQAVSSPDLSPIEQAFCYLHNKIKREESESELDFKSIEARTRIMNFLGEYGPEGCQSAF